MHRYVHGEVFAHRCVVLHTCSHTEQGSSGGSLEQEIPGRGGTHMRVLESTELGSTAPQHCALHNSLQDGMEH